MTRKTKTETEQPKAPRLVTQYRAVGPAAIVAALLYAPRKRKPLPTQARSA